MDLLEKYIIENRDKFDLEEPEPGHFERFAAKHGKQGNRGMNFTLKYILQAAAVTLLIALSSLWVYDRIAGGLQGRQVIDLADISTEYREAEIYYTSLITSKYNEIKSFYFQENPREQEILLRELSEMDTIYKSLRKELNTERGHQMVIHAMISHYQLKLDIMNRILEQLYQVQMEEKLKTEDDETIKI